MSRCLAAGMKKEGERILFNFHFDNTEMVRCQIVNYWNHFT